MVFLISCAFGLFLGWKLKGAFVFLKQAKDVNYIKTIVQTILSDNEIKLYKSLHENKAADMDLTLQEEFLRFKMQEQNKKLQEVQ